MPKQNRRGERITVECTCGEVFTYTYKRGAFKKYCPECIKLNNRESQKTPKCRYSHYRSSAAKREITFGMTLLDFMELWNKPCEYCGSEINGIGVDRVDSSIGYEPGNIVPCCSICNSMKSTLGRDTFIGHITKVYIKATGIS